MRKFPLISASILALVTFAGCDSGNDTGSDDVADTSDDNTDNTDNTEIGTDDDGGCYEQPPECAQFLLCIDAIIPGQGASLEAQYGTDGSCWCGSEADAVACYNTCRDEIEKGKDNFPTVKYCHENWCELDELNLEEPYGPINGGSCDPYLGADGETMVPQYPVMNPFGVAGSFCTPECSGIANACPEHTQTSATGTCYLIQNNQELCISRCYVNSEAIGGTQCQCGATCQPQGAPDGEGNMRGICTFE